MSAISSISSIFSIFYKNQIDPKHKNQIDPKQENNIYAIRHRKRLKETGQEIITCKNCKWPRLKLNCERCGKK